MIQCRHNIPLTLDDLSNYASKKLRFSCFLCCGLFSTATIASTEPTSWQVATRSPFNSKIQTTNIINYIPLLSAQKSWKICVLIPNLKDSYWIGINYGLFIQAKALSVQFSLFEAGGYSNIATQIKQLHTCAVNDSDAILLGAVEANILTRYQQQYETPIAKPIIALVNQLNSPRVHTRIGVSWYEMGLNAGSFIRQHSTQSAKIALFAGPNKQGGSAFVEQGVTQALKNSKIQITSHHYADNNRDLYRDEFENLLSKSTSPDYILGSAVALEAGIGALTKKAKQDDNDNSPQIQLISSYLSPAVLRGILRHRILFSNDDSVVTQGKLAIDITVKELQGMAPFGDIGPIIKSQYLGHISPDYMHTSFAPADFHPIYRFPIIADTVSNNEFKPH